jgi:hypothetical protein
MLANDVLSVLHAVGVVVAQQTGFVGSSADTDGDGIITVQETAGQAGVGTHDSPTAQYERPACQVVARHADYFEAEKLARRAYDALWSTRHTLVGGFRYVEMRPRQTPFDLQRDTKNRQRFAFNVDGLRGR